MDDVEFYYEGKQFRQAIPLREIQVDYNKDIDPNKPLPSIHEITVKNNTPNRLTEFLIETNLPKESYDVQNIPASLHPYKSVPIRLVIYGKRLFEGPVPESVKLYMVYKEVIQRS